mmetsp:Transcript_72892/g.126567  ORF Transcript_72892/g.126567 Transcript_72892/m.126567 type:complete len:179 (+) Transcript_72892:102-638(+)
MSDDDWLENAPAPVEEHRPARQMQSAQANQSSAARSAAPRPQVLQRPKDAEDRNASDVVDRPAPKTMKQKEAEYAAARARIFGTSGPKAGAPAAGRGSKGQGKGGRGRAVQGYGGPQRGGGGGSGRRRENDAADPDYDRNPTLYAPRLAPSQLEEPMPDASSSRYVPPTYENEFPALG